MDTNEYNLMEKSTILVNATAARDSGALTILNQFIDNIAEYSDDVFYIFVDPSFKKRHLKNVHYVEIDTKQWIKRIIWDEYGFRKCVLKKNIKASLIISFQNLAVRFDESIPQLVYYHQLLSLSDHKWNLLKNKERLLFLYRNIYPYFISRHLSMNVHFVVQLPSTKYLLLKRIKRSKVTTIHVVRPHMEEIEYNKVENLELERDLIHLLYPATSYIYKNHIYIVETIYQLINKNKEIKDLLRVHFTLSTNEDSQLYNQIIKYGLSDNFCFEGKMSKNQLLSFYKFSDGLIFPSYIESFGLPLLEAASFGLPILVSDLPYARDVLGSYTGATFIKLDDNKQWQDNIIKLCNNPLRYPPFFQSTEDSWKLFFDIITKIKK